MANRCAADGKFGSGPREKPRPRVYVAGSSAEVARVLQACDALRERGIEPLASWVYAVAKEGPNPRDATVAQRAGWARADLQELQSARVLLLLVPDPPNATSGAWWEAGAAWHAAMPIVCAGDTLRSVFCALGLEYLSDHDAIVAAAGIALGDVVRRP